MASRRTMPKTPGQFLALSLLACALLAGQSAWNWARHDMAPQDTLLLTPAPDRPLLNRANRHLLFVPFAAAIALGGLIGAAHLTLRRHGRRAPPVDDRGTSRTASRDGEAPQPTRPGTGRTEP